jgi:hypothetical protein
MLDTDMPYIAADSGAARRDDAWRLSMQVASPSASQRARCSRPQCSHECGQY